MGRQRYDGPVLAVKIFEIVQLEPGGDLIIREAALREARNLNETFIRSKNMNRWRLFWIQADDGRADRQQVFASIDGAPEVALSGFLGMTTSEHIHDFAETNVVSWRVKTLNADSTLMSFSVPRVFAAANPANLAPATGLNQQFIQTV